MNLPHLLYLSDVPVEASYHGSALLFRLLENYPCERLVILESNLLISLAERQLPGVRYATVAVGNSRLLHTRFAAWYSSWLTLNTGGRARRIESLLASFHPEAVLTVAHGYLWETAARFAAARGLPLHLICHDDWPRVANLIRPVRGFLDARFGGVYRQATSRLCVSPFMRDDYRRRYGVDGEVLYPSRAADCPSYKEPPRRLGEQHQKLTVAFGGSINSPGYVRALKSLAEMLDAVGGRLLIFGPLKPEDARREGLERQNVELRGLVKSDELMRCLRDEADVLFVPMSFDEPDRANMTMAFPSKLTDYTAVGLPLLIYGPDYCSAVRWAQENADVAEVVTTEGAPALAEAVDRLAQSPARRIELGTRALEIGERYFACASAQSILENALLSRTSVAVAGTSP